MTLPPSAPTTVVLSANTGWYLFNFRGSTVQALIADGHRVVCVCPKDEYANRLEELGAIWHPVSLSRGGMNPVAELRTIASFYNIYRKIRPGLVLNFTPKCNIYSGMAAAAVGVPHINNISGVGYLFRRAGVAAMATRFLYRLSLRSAFRVLFQNAADHESFLQQGYVREAQARRVWGSGVPLSRFRYSPSASTFPLRFLFVGRLLEEKGVVRFAEAARRLAGRDLHFAVLGALDPENPSGIREEQLNDWVSEGAIEYLGFTDRVDEFLVDYDAVVLPTLYGEGMPRALLEAAAMGKIIITSDHPGCRETVTPESGFLLRPVTVEAICEAIRTFRDMTVEDRLAMSRAARRLAEERFSDEANIAVYKEALAEALLSRDAGR